jgi:glycosyltransferase involved in cell wall biosynthesis
MVLVEFADDCRSRSEKVGMNPARVMFVYWGRRGALTQFTLEVGRAALANQQLAATISVSRQNEAFASYQEFGPALFAVDTFAKNSGAVLLGWRIAILRRRLYQRLLDDGAKAVVELMPHVWSPFVMPAAKAARARYVTIVHDAVSHSGDHRSQAVRWAVDRAMSQADLILTLGGTVARRIEALGNVPRDKLRHLFHPDLSYGAPSERTPPQPREPLRLMFLGRIMRYKGLPLFLDAIDILRREGLPLEVGVFGEGKLGASAPRLADLGAEVINRWLSETEMVSLLQRYHTVVLSHIEASQSGVVAAAFGAGLPVVATPVGGLIEQIRDGVNGILADRADAPALAHAIKRLLLDARLYRSICKQLATSKDERSMARFVQDCVRHALNGCMC